MQDFPALPKAPLPRRLAWPGIPSTRPKTTSLVWPLAFLLVSSSALAAPSVSPAVSPTITPAVGQTPGPVAEIFSDDFETGDVSRWSLSVGYLPPADPFRFADLDLRDPHTFVTVDIGIPFCVDATDENGFGASVNGNIQTAITTDGDGDLLLDLSVLLLFRPLDPLAEGLRLDLAQGRCSTPIELTSCDPEPLVEPVVTTYDGLDVGTCLTTLPGTTSGYSPGIAEPTAPCFITAPQTLTVDFLGIPLELTDAQIAGTWTGMPEDTVESGLLFGFLAEADADAILIPAEIPLVGGLPLSALFPGGTGNCAAGDDRDIHQEVTGWWLYFNYRADAVPYGGP